MVVLMCPTHYNLIQRRETEVHCGSNAGLSSSIMTYIKMASVWHLLVVCADPGVVLFIHSDLSEFVQWK